MKVFLIYMKDLRICNYIQLNYERVFIMLMRSFAGGVVFSGDKVLLFKNERNEWMLPRGKMHDGEISSEAAVRRIMEESG